MAYREEGTYYLYGRSYNLQLGHLLLGNYKNPTHVPHCQIPPMSDDELLSWADITPLSGTFSNTRGWNINLEVEVFEAGRLGGGHSTEERKVVTATSGRRIEIPGGRVRNFFEAKVLSDQGVKENLRRWLTVSRTRYVLTQVGLKSVPEVWCLTGLWELSDVTLATVVRNNPSATLGISSALVGAMSGVPVGAAIDIGRDFAVTCDSKEPGIGVWAAQYQLIKTRSALIISDESGETPPINYVKLYPDYTYAGGGHLGEDEDEGDDALELEVDDVGDGDASVDEFDEEYWKFYREANRINNKMNMLIDVE